MCGRYFIDSDEPTMGTMLSALSPETPIHGGEVFPSNMAPVITRHGELATMLWGFPRFDGKGLIINARSETAAEKPMLNGVGGRLEIHRNLAGRCIFCRDQLVAFLFHAAQNKLHLTALSLLHMVKEFVQWIIQSKQRLGLPGGQIVILQAQQNVLPHGVLIRMVQNLFRRLAQ